MFISKKKYEENLEKARCEVLERQRTDEKFQAIWRELQTLRDKIEELNRRGIISRLER